MSDLAFIYMRNGLSQGIQIRKYNERCKRHKNPGPGTQRVMRDLEQDYRTHGMVGVLCRQHALSNITTATWLRPRIPNTPPLYNERDNENRHSGFYIAEIRKERNLASQNGIVDQTLKPPN